MALTKEALPFQFAAPDLRSGYSFIDRTQNQHFLYIDAREFADDHLLGRDLSVNLVVKWLNQGDHDANLRILAGGKGQSNGTAIASRNHNLHRYYEGFVGKASLDTDAIVDEPEEALHTNQPTGFDKQTDETIALACADKIHILPAGLTHQDETLIEHPSFARLHSVAFSRDGQRLLTASSSLDLLFELDPKSAEVVWSMDLWEETPFNTNPLAQAFYRRKPPSFEGRGLVYNPSSFNLRENMSLRGASCVIDNPRVYGGLGLATALTPVFVNSASYDNQGKILATSFSRGEAWRIDKDSRQVEVLAKNMGHPHGLYTTEDAKALFVSDTLNERVLFLNKESSSGCVIDFSKLNSRKAGLENAGWLQNTTQLGPDLYCAVITTRSALTLFDPVRAVKRDIPFNPEWGVQMVTA